MIKKIKATQPIADFINMNGYTILAASEIIWRCDGNGISQPFMIGQLQKEIKKEPFSMPITINRFKSNPIDCPISFQSLFH